MDRPVSDLEAETAAPLPRRVLGTEVIVVFAVSLGASGLFALIRFLGDLAEPIPLAKQRAVVVGSYAPGQPWLDLSLQLAAIVTGLAPVALVAYLLYRSGESLVSIGVDFSRFGRDFLLGCVLAAVIGGSGLALYLAAHAAGVNLTVVAADLPDVWWRIPIEILAAIQNGILEEVLVVGYLLHRLDQMGWSPRSALLTSAAVRGSYHLYQGLGGFFGNAVMGLIFGWVYQRWHRTTPLVVAHSLIDAVAFVGYTLLVGHVSWIPS
ncbi:MAG TPA: type II CAAX endopeptidase family protein [Nocardioidaceae bacterium]|nr:type II CAAX endopeptidase family protein [Nocardioidaceae bacterium]